jgi:hypothetical protein
LQQASYENGNITVHVHTAAPSSEDLWLTDVGNYTLLVSYNNQSIEVGWCAGAAMM